MFFRTFVLALLLALTQPLHAQERLKVLATFAPIYSLTANVVGNSADLEVLLPGDAGPHGFALSPRDLKKLAKADVIIANGAGVEEWLDRALERAARPGVVRVIASERIAHIENPHVWLDPVMAVTMVETIRDALMARDKANAEVYEANAAAFIRRLRLLDAEIRSATANLPHKTILAHHNAMECFASRYGFEMVGTIAPFPGREPTPKYLKQLKALIKEKGVTVIFAEPQYPARIIESMSEDLGIAVAGFDPMETGEPSAGLYEKVMHKNLQSLLKALGPAR